MPGEQPPVVGGRYRLIERLESDAMSEIWLAGDLGRNSRLVAAERLLRPGLAQADTAELDRGRREAEAVAGVRHPNVVRVIDYVVESGEPYVVMEYQAGDTLAELIARGGLSAQSAVMIVRQAAAGLAAVHRAGIVHRDVRPGHIVIGPSGRAMITDFGIVLVGQDTRVTDTGLIAYRAPEVLEGSEPTAASDMWALGACLYEALEGHAAFRGERAPDLMRAVVTDPLPVSDRVALAPVIDALLRRDPRERMTGEQAATALGQILAREEDLDARSAPAADTAPLIESVPVIDSAPVAGASVPLAEQPTTALPGVPEPGHGGDGVAADAGTAATDRGVPAHESSTQPLPVSHDTLPLEFGPAPGARPGAPAGPPAGRGPTSDAARPRNRRRLTWLLLALGVVVVLLVAGGIVLAATSGSKDGKGGPTVSRVPATTPTTSSAPAMTGASTSASAPAGSGAARGQAPQSILDELANVPPDVSNTVGPGSIDGPSQRLSGTPLLTDDLPRILFVGSESCGLCAAQRWPLVITLMRFGVFTSLSTVESVGQPAPGTATFSFHGSHYASPSVDLDAYEISSTQSDGHGGFRSLDTISRADMIVLARLNAGTVRPVIDIGGRYAFVGASYNLRVLSGLSREQIAAALRNADSPVTKAVLGTANVMTAAVCVTTHQAPAAVCDEAGVRSAAGLLPTH